MERTVLRQRALRGAVGGTSVSHTFERREVCPFCGRDLWEVERYLWAGNAAICEDCVATAFGALQAAEPAAVGAVPFPPRLFGTAPDEDAVDAVVAAILVTFGPPRSEPGLPRREAEDAEELEPYIVEAGRRYPVRPGATRVQRLRFLDDDTADVEFVIGLVGRPAAPFSGGVVRRGERWLVTRDTVLQVLQSAGVSVPPNTATT
jgi:ClpX C4-type zinc finger